MLRLYVCQKCRQYFPAPSGGKACCPVCEKTAVETEYFMVDLINNNAQVTREIYRKYNIGYEEFTDMMNRVDNEERMHNTFKYRMNRFFYMVRSVVDSLFSRIRKIFKK